MAQIWIVSRRRKGDRLSEIGGSQLAAAAARCGLHLFYLPIATVKRDIEDCVMAAV